VIAESARAADVDLSDVVLVGVEHNKVIAVDISLVGEGRLKGISAVGTDTKKNPNTSRSRSPGQDERPFRRRIVHRIAD
jgi:hypothetical protein